MVRWSGKMNLLLKVFDKTRIPLSGQYDECWEWLGGISNKSGHGRIYDPSTRKLFYPHRIVYEGFYGQIPDGLCVLHACGNGSCVNPAHLYAGTKKDNVLDAVKHGVHANQYGKAGKTHCIRGHEYTPENTGYNKTGGRFCKACSRIRSRIYYQNAIKGNRK